MGFFSPLWLLLGFAASVPLLLHLFHRVQGRRVVFPALRYLRRAEKESARRIRLRQWLLLALRAALILLLALAAARPLARRGGGAHPPTDVVIILDNSLSSGRVIDDRTVLDNLKLRALETLQDAGSEDRFWLIRAGSPWDAAAAGDAVSTAARLRATAVAATAADLAASIARADALLAAQPAGRPQEIHLLSDLQRSNAPTMDARDANSAPVVVYRGARDEWRGAAITDVQLNAGVAPRARARFEVAVTTAAYDDAPDPIPVRIVIDGRVAALGNTAPGNTVALQLPPRQAGFLAGWAETEADALRGDDRRYFAARIQPPPVVAVTTPTPFVDDALAVLAAGGRITLAGQDAGVVIAPDGAGADALRRGAAVVILPPDDAVRLPALNRHLAAAAVPWRYAPAATRGEIGVAASGADAELDRALRDARISVRYRLTASAASADTVLLRTSAGDAWAIAGTVPGGGRYVLFASPFSAAAGSIATSAAMVPMLDRALGAWATAGDGRVQARPGEYLAFDPDVRIVRPDSVRDAPSAGTYRVPAVAGIYRVLRGDSTIAVFAVNAPASESDPRRITARNVREFVRGDVTLAGNRAEWQRAVYRQRAGREIWRIFVLLALCAMIAEGWVATSGRAPKFSTVPANAGSTL